LFSDVRRREKDVVDGGRQKTHFPGWAKDLPPQPALTTSSLFRTTPDLSHVGDGRKHLRFVPIPAESKCNKVREQISGNSVN
jgi:hypothetical protein